MALVLAGCASAPRAGGGPAPVLDGAYHASSGPLAWLSFRGDRYAAWSSDPGCSDVTRAPATCAELGRFAVDGATLTLTLTSDAGRVSVHGLEVLANDDVTAATQNLAPATFTDPGGPLVERSEPLVVKDFQLADFQSQRPSVFFRAALFCRVLGLLAQPIPSPAVLPILPPTPPPIERQQCSDS